MQQLTGCDADRLRFCEVDLCDREALEKLFKQQASKDGKPFVACIHFAGMSYFHYT